MVTAEAQSTTAEEQQRLPGGGRPSRGRLSAGLGVLKYRLLAIIVFLLLWYILADFFAAGNLPSPLDVWEAMLERLRMAQTYEHVGVTIRRVLIATVGASILGIALGILMGIKFRAEAFFHPYVVVGLSIPGPVYIIMSLLILGIGETSTMIALVMSVGPFVTTIAFQAAHSRDKGLDQMRRVYRLPLNSYLRHVIVPQLAPGIFSALRTGFAMSWKLVVLMEALSTSDGIGAQMVSFFRLLEPAVVVAYLILFMVFMLLVENLIIAPVERRALRWQQPSDNTAEQAA